MRMNGSDLPVLGMLGFGLFALLAAEVVVAQGEAWVARYNGPGNGYDAASAVAVDDSGYVYVTGSSLGLGTMLDYTTVKYGPNGDTVWVSRYDGPGGSSDMSNDIALDASGNIYVTGQSWGSGANWDFMTIKYSSAGDTLWVRTYDGPANQDDYARILRVDASDNIYVAGHSSGSGTSFDFATIKYNSAGDSLWVRRYNGPSNGTDIANDLAVDGGGNVFITGRSTDFVSSLDYATIKYGSTGDTLWVSRYNGPANSGDAAQAVAVDASGNVYVTGYDTGPFFNSDYATIKYDSLGDTIWVRRYSSPVDFEDAAYDIAVDNSGNAFVTGTSEDVGTSNDYLTIKYNSIGDSLWTRRFCGPGGASDLPSCIALDPLGNVCVTGESWGPGTLQDFATVKYSGAGDSVWARRYNGPADSADQAMDMAVDVYSNVYVTGGSGGIGTSSDFVTIKYCYVDAKVLGIVAPPDTVLLDSVYSPQAWFQNSGGCDADSFDVTVTIGALYTDSAQVTSLALGDSGLVTFAPWTVSAGGSFLVTVCALLPDDEAPANDCLQKNVYSIGPMHDCGIVGLDSPGDTVFSDSIYPVVATVRNYGDYPETFDVVATIDSYADTVQVSSLAPDSILQVNFADWQVPSADSTLYTMVVCARAADDADSTNDCGQKSIFAYIHVGVSEYGIREPRAMRFGLCENRPDPFRQSTKIRYFLSNATGVTLTVHDITGRLVETLADEIQQPGTHQVVWSRKSNPSGVYFCRLMAGEFTETRKMVILD